MLPAAPQKTGRPKDREAGRPEIPPSEIRNPQSAVPKAAAADAADGSLDSLTTAETEQLVDEFFGALIASPAPAPPAEPESRATADLTDSTENVRSESVSTVQSVEKTSAAAPPADDVLAVTDVDDVFGAAPGEEPAHEYDPTAAMNEELDISEVDVFGDVAAPHAAPVPEARMDANGRESAPSAGAPVGAAPPDEAGANPALAPAPPIAAPTEPPPIAAPAQPAAGEDKRTKKKRRFWNWWRSRGR